MVGAYPWLKDPRSFLIIVLSKISIDNLLTCSLKLRPHLRPQLNLGCGLVLNLLIRRSHWVVRSVKKIYPSWSTLDIQFHVISTLPLDLYPPSPPSPPPPFPPECLLSTPYPQQKLPCIQTLLKEQQRRGKPVLLKAGIV